jgi:hypothetical protein
MFCSVVRWALLLLALLEWADARTGTADLSWSLLGFILVCMYWEAFSWWNSKTSLVVGLAHYGTARVQWYVMHSHECRLPGSMIDDEFEVCFELLLSVVLAKRRM